MSNQSATVIEDILEVISQVPITVKRNLELVRELDMQVDKLLIEIAETEASVVKRTERASNAENLRQALGEEGVRELETASAKRRKCDDLTEEKIAIAQQTEELVIGHIDMMSKELAALSTHLHSTGEFESSGAARPGDDVAIRLEDTGIDSAWILARVVKFRPETATYEVADADDENNLFELAETDVVPLIDSLGRGSVAMPHALAPVCSVLALDNSGSEYRLSKGDDVFAIYPDTTSFYAAVITAPPRGRTSNVCHVQFNDDADPETGLNPDRAVPLKYVLRPVV